MHHHLVRSQQALWDDELDRAFGALSDRTRRAILARLADGEAGVLALSTNWWGMNVATAGLDIAVAPGRTVISFQRFLKAPPAMVLAAWTKPVFIYETSPDEVCLDTVTFEPFDDGTIVIRHSAFPSLAVRNRYLAAGAARGLTKSHHRLDVLLRTLQETNSGRRLDK